MKTMVILSLLVAVAVAAVPRHRRQVGDKPVAPVLVREELLGDQVARNGNYRYSYEISDGTAKDETAQIESRPGDEKPIHRVTGSYRWVDELGREYLVNYIADENGFQPQGAHFPTPVPVPV